MHRNSWVWQIVIGIFSEHSKDEQIEPTDKKKAFLGDEEMHIYSK